MKNVAEASCSFFFFFLITVGNIKYQHTLVSYIKKLVIHFLLNKAAVYINSPIVLKSFLTLVVDIVLDDMSLSAIIGEMFILAHRAMKGRAENIPFCKHNKHAQCIGM